MLILGCWPVLLKSPTVFPCRIGDSDTSLIESPVILMSADSWIMVASDATTPRNCGKTLLLPLTPASMATQSAGHTLPSLLLKMKANDR